MSKTEKKTKDAAETKSTDTAPYMKKNSENESSAKPGKSNIVIPLVLLLVSAIVIVATFYEDEYNSLLAQGNAQNEFQDNTVDAENVTAEATPSEATANTTIEAATEVAEETVAKTLTAETPANEETSTASIEAPAAEADVNGLKNTQSKSQAAANTVKVSAVTVSEQSKVSQSQPAKPHTSIQAANTADRYNGYNRAQAQAKKHQEFMQQRRQAYEKEMQTRRAQYEAAMKAQQEKRTQVIEAQRAVYERAQQNRLENKQKIEQLHEKISQMHKEIHQIMNESYAPRGIVSPAPVPATKQMQSI